MFRIFSFLPGFHIKEQKKLRITMSNTKFDCVSRPLLMQTFLTVDSMKFLKKQDFSFASFDNVF